MIQEHVKCHSLGAAIRKARQGWSVKAGAKDAKLDFEPIEAVAPASQKPDAEGDGSADREHEGVE